MNLKKVLASLFSLSLVLSPMSVCAEESIGTIYAYSQNPNETTRLYRTIEDAWDDACAGTKICLSNDWILSSRLVIPEGKTVTIEMNGYKIDRNLSESESDGEVIYMSENSSLTITGSEESTTSVKNLYENKNGVVTSNVTLGGFITGGASSNGGGGIHMKAGCKLTLDHVGVVGNNSEYLLAGGGGIMADGKSCEINLNNGSMVSYNYAYNDGAGIYVNDEDTYINMDNSVISYNRSSDEGGGIYSDEDATRVSMSNNSKIENNLAKKGGGLYFNDSYSLVQSSDYTGVISDNLAKNSDKTAGGAIYYANVSLALEEAEIKNITLKNNKAICIGDGSSKGGAIYTCQDDLTLTNCTLTNNFADIGGAVYANDDMTLNGSTIENNEATSKGGGVYVDSTYNVTLHGTLFVQNNTRTDTNKKDDIYLDSDTWTQAHVSNSPDTGSKIGLLGIGESLVAIQQGTEDWADIYFLDESDSYHLVCDEFNIYERKGATGSIFGNGNLVIASGVMVGIVAVGAVILVANKKKKNA